MSDEIHPAEDSERDLDRDATNDRDIFEEARDRLQISLDAEDESENRTAAKADIVFREGDQWDKQPYTTAEALNQPELTINLTDALVRRVVNNMKQQRPRGKAHPVGDGASIEKAEIINGIGRHIEYRSDAGIAYDWGGEMAVTGGWGFWRVLEEWAAPDSMDKELRIAPIFNTFSVYMDPGAVMPTGQDAMWCLVTYKMQRREYKRQHPGSELVSFSEGDDGDREWEDREQIRVAEYFRIREKSAKLYLLRSADGTEYTRYEDKLPDAQGLEAAKTEIIGERESSKRVVEWFLLNGTKVVDRSELPGEYIPIIRCQGNAAHVDGKIKRRGMVRSMRDPARMLNYGETAKIKRLGLAPQAPWIAAEGQLEGHPEWSDTNTSAHPVLIYKPETIPSALGGEILLPPPMRQPPAQIEAGFSELVEGMRANLFHVAGMENDPGVDAQGEVVSGQAIKRRQGLSDQSHFQYYDNQTLAIAHTWRILLPWIAHCYSGKRMQRIVHEDGTPEMIQLAEGDLDIGRYDVVMDTGPGYETRREEGAATLVDLLRVAPLAELVVASGADLIFRSLDHPYMQELADRIEARTPEGLQRVMAKMPAQARSVIQSLFNENAKLKQAVEASKSGLDKEALRIHGDQQREMLRAHTQRSDTELQGAIDIIIERLKHQHEGEMADRQERQLMEESNGT